MSIGPGTLSPSLNSPFIRKWKKQKDRLRWVIDGVDYDRLTKWEEMFLEDIEATINDKHLLSDKQLDVLERIYKEKGR